MKGLIAGLGIVLVVAATGLGTKLLVNYFNDQYINAKTSEPIKNLTYERNTFVKFCIDGALENQGVTFETANNYRLKTLKLWLCYR